MGDKKSRAKLAVALIGVGPTWELHYREAIQNLSEKLSVRAICDSVAMRAAVVADEFEATPISCPWLLTQRTDLQAWLILDPGWFDIYPADLAVKHGRPALFANTFAAPIPRLMRTLQSSLANGETLMPEFPQRFTPATTRLRELMATKLGRVCQIEVSVPLPKVNSSSIANWLEQNLSEAIGLIDWCHCLIDDSSSAVSFKETATGQQFELTFPARTNGDKPPARATIRFDESTTSDRRVNCERGSAVITPTEISWQTKEESAQESFGNERSPYEIIVDQFCRRAIGGLVPVPTLNHAIRAISTAQMALDAVRS